MENNKIQFIRANIDTVAWANMSEHAGVGDRYSRRLAKENGIK